MLMSSFDLPMQAWQFLPDKDFEGHIRMDVKPVPRPDVCLLQPPATPAGYLGLWRLMTTHPLSPGCYLS